MSFENMALNERFATFISPVELRHGEERASVEELRVSGVLPKARLLEASAWVYPSKNYMAGRPLQLTMGIGWDGSRKQWVWQVEWRKLISRFYKAKMQVRAQTPRQTCHARRRSVRARPL
jgi:hypothetical protein